MTDSTKPRFLQFEKRFHEGYKRALQKLEELFVTFFLRGQTLRRWKFVDFVDPEILSAAGENLSILRSENLSILIMKYEASAHSGAEHCASENCRFWSLYRIKIISNSYAPEIRTRHTLENDQIYAPRT